MNNKTSQSGFTLIELIAVMVILGILAAVIIPRISTITSGAYESNVRAMYGLIKNEVNAQAVKAAMSGGAQGHLERYPDPDNNLVDHYLAEWVDDYDPDMWTSFTILCCYPNSTNAPTGGISKTGVALFMYHPHGKPVGPIIITSDGTPAAKVKTDGDDSAAGAAVGASTSYEDIYWIYYAPRTSNEGKAAGRQLDSFVMGAWKNSANDWTFGGNISAAGAVATANDIIIADLSYIQNAD
jgi:prepilin-type N-terminal cleavage/methylation domain-containing protein